MKQSRARAQATSGLALLLAAAVYGVLAQPPRDAHGALSEQEQVGAPANGRHEAVLRSWLDRVKIDGRDETRIVEIVFDYELGAARRRVYDAQDWLISDEVLGGQPRATSAEIDEAFDTVLRDPELGQLARSANAIIDGGFLLREAPGEVCGPPARCLQVYMLSESGHEELQRPIVDLNPRARIVYRDYQPDAPD
jgi:hypothetical protein